jgi:2-oxoglutarate ferredoxin oxidoreductase subunit beta
MTQATKAKVNRLGLDKNVYKGSRSTLCPGCGHNSITNHLITAMYEYGVNPTQVAKMSGIGCSSKTPAYFLSQSHGFNGTHGRMPSLATGAKLANRDLVMVGISGDGDTASIGMGQYVHLVRRNLDMTYIIENNGVYGLTKGQFSATADKGTKSKRGIENEFETIDCCELALSLGASFVARSYSGDKDQMVALLKAAIGHRGTAVIDVISPCVTFNDHAGSTKSYDVVKDWEAAIHELDFIPFFETEDVEVAEGEVRDVTLPDGSHLKIKKVDSGVHDPSDRMAAIQICEEGKKGGHLPTGLLYIDESRSDLCTLEHMVEEPLWSKTPDEFRPTADEFAAFMKEFG